MCLWGSRILTVNHGSFHSINGQTLWAVLLLPVRAFSAVFRAMNSSPTNTPSDDWLAGDTVFMGATPSGLLARRGRHNLNRVETHPPVNQPSILLWWLATNWGQSRCFHHNSRHDFTLLSYVQVGSTLIHYPPRLQPTIYINVLGSGLVGRAIL